LLTERFARPRTNVCSGIERLAVATKRYSLCHYVTSYSADPSGAWLYGQRLRCYCFLRIALERVLLPSILSFSVHLDTVLISYTRRAAGGRGGVARPLNRQPVTA
jgi:hypothetical protein